MPNLLYNVIKIMAKKIGLYGGSFDPIHTGHLFVAQSVCELLDLDKVIFIPAFVSPHKTNTMPISVEHRMEMLNLAVDDNPSFEVSNYEIENCGISYSIDTILYFKKLFPKDDIFLIIGKDSLDSFETWKDYTKILKLVKVVVAERKSMNVKEISKQYSFDLTNVILLKTPNIEISSTDIRNRVLNQKSIKYLVPEAVKSYILENHIYGKK